MSKTHDNRQDFGTITRSQESDLADPEFLKAVRGQMLKFAELQLSDSALAEDAVQEALIGALKNASSFGRRSALKTWIFAILKNKIVDILRQRQRMPEKNRSLPDDSLEENIEETFDRSGAWNDHSRPGDWSAPAESIKEAHFWRVFEGCLNNLPGEQARLFMMREFLELDSHEICETLGISTSNLHVSLYRARMRLRSCMETHWFVEGEKR